MATSEDTKARLRRKREQVFAAKLRLVHLPSPGGWASVSRMSLLECLRMFQLSVMLEMLLEVVRKRQVVQAANDGLRFIALGDDDAGKPVFPRRHPAVSAR